MTHHLRAVHDSILVGIGTILADDPALTARLSESRNPQPVIVDSHLRTPVSCQLLQRTDCRPWIATTNLMDHSRAADLATAGAVIIPFEAAPDGRVPLGSLLDELSRRSISSLMVEGGAQVITSFLSQNLVDWVLITLAPRFVGGVHAVESLDNKNFPEISALMSEMVGPDLILWGDIAR
jgi:GTP cyclohydrolase II